MKRIAALIHVDRDEAARELRELVERHGNYARAAAAAGVSRRQVMRWAEKCGLLGQLQSPGKNAFIGDKSGHLTRRAVTQKVTNKRPRKTRASAI